MTVTCNKCDEDPYENHRYAPFRAHWVAVDLPDVDGARAAFLCNECYDALKPWILARGEGEGGETIRERELQRFFERVNE